MATSCVSASVHCTDKVTSGRGGLLGKSYPSDWDLGLTRPRSSSLKGPYPAAPSVWAPLGTLQCAVTLASVGPHEDLSGLPGSVDPTL